MTPIRTLFQGAGIGSIRIIQITTATTTISTSKPIKSSMNATEPRNDPQTQAEIQPLPEEFTKRDSVILWKFTRKARVGNVAVFLKTDTENPHNTGYETVVIRSRKAKTSVFDGKTVHFPAKEFYPSNDDWGTFGFTYRHLKDAMQKAQELHEVYANKAPLAAVEGQDTTQASGGQES